MGKSTISMAIFNCYVSSPEGNLCWGKWVTSLIKDILVNILLLYFSLFLQKRLKHWTWWRKTFNLRRRRFWHAVRVVLKNTHITSSHHHIVILDMQNSFFGLPRWAVSLLLTFLGRLGDRVFSVDFLRVTFWRCSVDISRQLSFVARWWQGQMGFLHGGTSTMKCPPLQREIRWC